MKKVLVLMVLMIIAGMAIIMNGDKDELLIAMEAEARQANTDEELETYLYLFVNEASKHGIDISHVLDQEYRISFTDTLYGRVLGISYGMYEDDKVIIQIPRKYWNQLSSNRKRAVMYHELGHDIFNIEHGQTPLMRALVKNSYTSDNLEKEINEMFNHAK